MSERAAERELYETQETDGANLRCYLHTHSVITRNASADFIACGHER